MFDNMEIENDLQEMRMLQDERLKRLIEALTNMENGTLTVEDKEVIIYECGLTRSMFVKEVAQ